MLFFHSILFYLWVVGHPEIEQFSKWTFLRGDPWVLRGRGGARLTLYAAAYRYCVWGGATRTL
jgi:hypothetical protein